jgi:hypothetical protein
MAGDEAVADEFDLARHFREELAFVQANVARGSDMQGAIVATLHRLAVRAAPEGRELAFLEACGFQNYVTWPDPPPPGSPQAEAAALFERMRTFQAPPASGYAFRPPRRGPR